MISGNRQLKCKLWIKSLKKLNQLQNPVENKNKFEHAYFVTSV